MVVVLYLSLLVNALFVLFLALKSLKDPAPPMPTERLLFLRRKAEKFRTLEYSEIWELFEAISKSNLNESKVRRSP